MQQIVKTVQKLGSEDTTKDEDEFTEEVSLMGGRKAVLDQVFIFWTFCSDKNLYFFRI
jgi:hypothetical protein